MSEGIGVAVIGAGMAGRAHAAAYRAASTVYESELPPIRLVSIGDVNESFGQLAAKRFGYERSDRDWRAIAEAADIDVVSIVIANALHREVAEGLLAAGKHVLCEKPLAETLEDARSMATAADAAEGLGRIGFTNLRAPALAAIRQLIESGRLGRVLHLSARYWTDYAADPEAPITWRYRGGAGSGALADLGSHALYLMEFLAGPVREVSGGRFATAHATRPVPLAATVGHGKAEVGEEREPVGNDDYAACNLAFADGAAGALEVSRVSHGHANGLRIEVFCEHGSASFDQADPSHFGLFLNDGRPGENGPRRVAVAPGHPYYTGGLPMDAPEVGFGHNDSFTYQARAFLEEVAGMAPERSLPRVPDFRAGIRNMEIIEAITESARRGGAVSKVPATAERWMAAAGWEARA